MKLHRFKVRHRLLIRLAIAEVLLIMAGGWLTMRAVEGELRSRVDEQLIEDAAELVAVLDALDRDALMAISETFSNTTVDISRDQWVAYVISPDGSSIAIGFDPVTQEAAPDIADMSISELRGSAGEPFTVGSVGPDGDSFRALTFPVADGSVVVTARSLGGVDSVLQFLHKVFTIAVALSVCGLAVLVWLISRALLRPLDKIVETADAIGQGNFAARVQVDESAPDICRLAGSMNTMAGRLQLAFAQQERSEARLRQFVSNASHELRTPLAAILGNAELYQERIARTPERIDQAMNTIATEGGRMKRLVEDLLLLARLDEGRALARDVVDLGCVVDSAVAAIRNISDDHRFVIDDDNAAVTVCGDEHTLRQAVDNLLINVVAHTPAGTTATIRVERRDASDAGGDDVARLVVTDDGPGMDQERAERMIDRFVRAESSRSRRNGDLGGTGLGLSIVDEVVRAHGGTVNVDTAPGAGMTFTVTLPAISSGGEGALDDRRGVDAVGEGTEHRATVAGEP